MQQFTDSVSTDSSESGDGSRGQIGIRIDSHHLQPLQRSRLPRVTECPGGDDPPSQQRMV
jgi:hypothetical protein